MGIPTIKNGKRVHLVINERFISKTNKKHKIKNQEFKRKNPRIPVILHF